MFYDENTERALLQRDSNRRHTFDNKPLIKSESNIIKLERKIGGSNHGVTPLKSKTERKIGGSKNTTTRKPTEWQLLIKKTMSENSMKMKDAIKHIKDNNLY